MRDNAPVPHTCSKINEVIDFIKSIHWDLEDEDEANFEYEAKLTLNVLEEIRSANDALRTWGNELTQEKNDLENELDELTRELSNLQSEHQDVVDENNSLSELIDELYQQINACE